jgi:hypothetical protein
MKREVIKMVSSLRRYYPDQVLRVFLSHPPTGGKHPGNFASILKRYKDIEKYFSFV